MKLTSVFLLAACLQVAANTKGQHVTIKVKNAPIMTVFKAVQQQTGYNILVDASLIDPGATISLDVKNKPVSEVMKLCLRGKDLDFSIEPNLIIIKPKRAPAPPAVVAAPVADTSITVSGLVVNEQDEAMPGATIMVKGTNLVTSSNPAGRFELHNIRLHSVLQVSFTGYATIEVPVNNTASLQVVLKKSTEAMNEVVVVAYGTRKKETLAGSVGVITSRDIESKPATNLLNAIQGVLPGLTVQRTSGRPGGEGYSFDIRGISSINGGSPLVIIDGIPNPLTIIDPNDVESISVLKDAAASMYGARAASGVVLITTKSGKKGKPVISYNTHVALKQPGFLKNKTSTLQYAEMYNEANVNDGKPKQFSDEFLERMRNNDPNPSPTGSVIAGFPQFFTTTDWNDVIYTNGTQQYHNLNLSGGSDNSTYSISGGYFNTGGIFTGGNNKSNRYNIRINYDYTLSSRLKMAAKFSYEEQDNFEPSMLTPTSGTFNVLSDFVKLPSFVPEKTPGGKYYQWQGFANPSQEMAEGGEAKSTENNAIGNLRLEYKLLDGLKLIGQAGITVRRTTSDAFFRTFQTYNWDESLNSRPQNVPNRASQSNSKSIYANYIGYLDYNKVLGGSHNISLMAGASRETYNFQTLSASGSNFASNEIFSFNLADKALLQTSSSGFAWGLNSFFSRASYVFANKYIVEGTARLDGSSRFAADKRWSALFPGVLVSWRASEENFIKDLKLVDELKFRGSWGQTGNQDINGLGYYNYIQLISIGTTGSYPFGNAVRTSSASLSGLASPERTWETVEMTNIGADVSLLQSRLSMSFDYFIKKNKNMLLSITLPEVLGVTPPTTNAGMLRVKGWELSVGWKDRIGKLEYSVRGALSDNQNKLVYVGGSNPIGTGLIGTKEGYPRNSYFGYVFDGIIQNQDELDDYKIAKDEKGAPMLDAGGNPVPLKGIVPGNLNVGDSRYKDINHDGSINTGDLVFLGNPAPRYNYSFILNLSWKGFDLAGFLQGVGKRTIIRSGDEFYRPFNKYWAQPLQYFYHKTWAPDRPDAKYARLSMDNNTLNWNYVPSDNQLVNTAYMRLKNFQVGYTLPASVISKLKLISVRVYFSGDNMWETSKGTWDGAYDPEEGDDAYTYPFVRTYSLGLNIKF